MNKILDLLARTLWLILGAAFTCGLVGFATPLRAQSFFGVDQNSPYPVYSISSSSAAATQVGNLSFQSYTLAKHPQTQLFYAVQNVSPYKVLSWNPVNNQVTIINNGLGIPLSPRLGFRADGTLYATRRDTSQLYRISTTNGLPTLIGTITKADIEVNSGDLAFSPSGQMFIVAQDRLYTVDLNNLKASKVGDTKTANLTGLAFTDDGRLFASSVPGSAPDSKLYQLSTTNASATLIGNTGRRIYDLANEYTPLPPVLAIAKTVTPASVVAAGTVTYAVTITNSGSGPAAVTQIRDVLPTGFTYVTGTSTGVTTVNPTISGQTLTWNGTFTVPAKVGSVNGSITLGLKALAGLARGVFLNNASISGSNFSTISTGDVAPVSVSAPQVTLTKSASPEGVKPGEQITYSVLYQNIGNANAQTLVINDPIPKFTTYEAGSMRVGNALSTYATATPRTDVAGDDEAAFDGTNVIFTINTVAPSDGVANNGADEGRVFFRVRLN